MSSKPQILIVDDAAENLKILIEVLKQDYTVSVYKDASQALEQLQNVLSPSLIILDIQMPTIDGFEMAKILKQDPKHRDVPIIFNTVANDSHSIQKGFEIGAADYITKPFNTHELKARVKTHVELYESRQQLKHQLNENASLLEQYKYIVDESEIVSKTDLAGNITYVNRKFEQISGYSSDELIGKPHSILRHPDMDKETFADLWSTIRQKSVWKGEVKNRNKSGNTYVVDSTVMPIVDYSGNIVEYISVRHDITDIYNLNKEIEDTQKEVVFTMGAIGESRSKETGNHVKRVAEYSYLLAKHYGLDEMDASLLKDASPMHDIGKVAIPDSILNKPGKLTPFSGHFL